jgi:magnesium-transporting ATPase (P-type)
VKNLDSIEAVASLDYLAVQSISLLDRDRENFEENKAAVAKLQAMGVKVVLATGVDEA